MKYLSAILLVLPFWVSAQSISITASDTSVCSGSAIIFTATTPDVMPHYQWTRNRVNVGADQPVYSSNTLSNADTITCLLVNAAHDTVFAISVDVVVNILSFPNAGLLTGRDSVCPGDSVHLLTTAAGGSWLATNLHASVHDGWVNGISAGQFECNYAVHDSILYIVTNQCGRDTAVKYMTIMPIPNAYFEVNGIGGSNGICIGPWSGARLTSGTTDFLCEGVPSSKNGKVSVSGIGAIWGTAVGIDTIINVSSNMCGISVYQVQVTVFGKPAPAVITPSKISVCNGQMDSAIITYSGLVNDLYYNPSIDSVKYLEQVFATRITAYIYGRNAGNDAIKLRLYNSCGYTDTSFPVEIKEQPSPIIATDTACAGYSSLLADNTTGGKWSVEAGNAAIQNENMLMVTKAGMGTIRYTAPNGCFAEKNILIQDCQAEAEVTPTPANGTVTIHTFVDLYDSYSIINSLGQVVAVAPLTGKFTYVDVSIFPPAIYYVRLSGSTRNSGAIKVVKY